jgi:hypothetical protein
MGLFAAFGHLTETQMGCPRSFDHFTKDFYNFRDSFDVSCLKSSNTRWGISPSINEEAACRGIVLLTSRPSASNGAGRAQTLVKIFSADSDE